MSTMCCTQLQGLPTVLYPSDIANVQLEQLLPDIFLVLLTVAFCIETCVNIHKAFKAWPVKNTVSTLLRLHGLALCASC
jgi:hypothetical protein